MVGINVKDEVDVCVVGAGPSGPAMAKHLKEAGLSVVLLEAGRKHKYPDDFTALPMDMRRKLLFPMKSRKRYPYMTKLSNNGHLFYADRYGNMILPPVPLYTNTQEGPVLTEPPTDAVINEAPATLQICGPGGTSLLDSGIRKRPEEIVLDELDKKLPPRPNSDLTWKYELLPYFEYLESYLPVTIPKGYLTNAGALVVTGAKNTIIKPLDDEGNPNPIYEDLKDMLQENEEGNLHIPESRDGYFGYIKSGGYAVSTKALTSNCRHCGNCHIACGAEVKKTSAVTFVPDGEKLGVELRTESLCLAVLHPDPAVDEDNDPYPNIVIYGTLNYDPLTKQPERDANGHLKFKELCAQPALIVSFAAGGIETPRLWLQSNALCNDEEWEGIFEEAINTLNAEIEDLELYPELYIKQAGGVKYTLYQNEHVGTGLVCDDIYYVFGIYDKPLLPQFGPGLSGLVSFPGYGGLSDFSWTPQIINSSITLTTTVQKNDFYPYPETDEGIWTDWTNFGATLKELAQNWMYTLSMWIFVADNIWEEANRIFLDPYDKETVVVGDTELQLCVPALQYVIPQETRDNGEKLQKVCIEILKNAANPNSELTLQKYYVLNNPVSGSVSHANTMRLGEVVDSNCEAVGAERIFVTDLSILPSTINGGPTLTCMAMALRAAEAVTCKYKDYLFSSEDKWKKWECKMIGLDHFCDYP